MSALAVEPAVTTIVVNCPEWCDESAERHVHELSSLGGTLIHVARDVVKDPTGREQVVVGTATGLDLQRHKCDPLKVSMHVVTDLNGVEVESPTIMIGNHETTLEQAERVAQHIAMTTESYVRTGGLMRRTWQALHRRLNGCPPWCHGHDAPGEGWDGDNRAHSRDTGVIGELDNIGVRAVQVERKGAPSEPAIVEVTIQTPGQAELSAFDARCLAEALITAAEMVEASDHARREAQS